MAWLVSGTQVLASVEVADSWRDRMRGVIGRDDLEGALLLHPASSVHTIGVRFPLDICYCDADLNVVEITTMDPNRIGRPRRRARVVIEARRGSMERWGIAPGQRLEVSTTRPFGSPGVADAGRPSR